MPSYQLDPAEPRPVPTRLGRYELIGHLATGGMAEIHLARLAGEEGFVRLFVVKRLLPELTASRQYIEMLFDEGRIAGRLDHPNVCEVFELGRDGAECYLVMPYLDGVPVHELIARPREADRRAELRIWAGVITQACTGLHYAHELCDDRGAPLQLVHRDISPSNLFVTAAGVVKVLDFGIAKTLGSSATEAGTIKGKTQYMSPEQLVGGPLDRRSDVFALGIVMFELATHQRLFKRDSEYLTARAILEEPIPRADAVDPAIPAAVADVIAKALARARDDRYADARQLAQAVVEAMAAHGGIATSEQIGAIVTASDQLSALRTRQARIVEAARATTEERSVTRPLRGEKTTLSPPPGSSAGDDSAATHIARAATAAAPQRRRTAVIATVAALLAATLATIVVAIALRSSSAPAGDAGRSALAPDAAVATSAPPADAVVSVPVLDAAVATTMDAAVAPTPPPVPRTGTVSIDSTPFATIYVDGKRLDVTPILGRSLPAGRHRIRAVLADGRSKDLVVDVPAGKSARPLVLTW